MDIATVFKMVTICTTVEELSGVTIVSEKLISGGWKLGDGKSAKQLKARSQVTNSWTG